MPKNKARVESFVWSDDEVELLLHVTLDYKTKKFDDGVDWESCPSKYGDIMVAFQTLYPVGDVGGGKDFRHDPQVITKAQVSTKIKSIRGKYRQALDTGRWSGHGRVVLMFFKLCCEIWGGSPATDIVETEDLSESPSASSASPAAVKQESSPEETPDSLPSVVIKQRRDLLRAKLNRGEKRRRNLPADPAVLEDLKIKKRMLDIMEQSERRACENLQQINLNVANITNTIQESLALMRDFLRLQQQNTAPPLHDRGMEPLRCSHMPQCPAVQGTSRHECSCHGLTAPGCQPAASFTPPIKQEYD
ncbi:uncharacterized protein LOC114785144 [Denticeps clupeoides]|uniref:uncharacterized protein LOC114785144 n=1 Tax=Denticeps clupeoides TaxID=299321 RepID=UPI0010A58A33|nr:uncharacterized protein LOC114785144 [Denticeps clupeoides]